MNDKTPHTGYPKEPTKVPSGNTPRSASLVDFDSTISTLLGLDIGKKPNSSRFSLPR